MPLVRHARVLGVAGLVALLASGCAAASGTDTTTPAQQAGRGVSGTITGVSSATLQVQSAATGSASIVSFTSSTRITDAVAGTLADVKAGDCITARSAATTAAAASPAAGTPLVAATLLLSQPTNGSCTGGANNRTFTPGAGFTPSARPSPAVSQPAGGFALGAFGTVQSVSGSTIVVATTGFAANGQTPTPGTETVTTNAQTKVTKRVDGTSASLKAGRCVVATGQTDAAGVTTATQLALSDPVNGQCTMAGRGGFGGRGAGAGTGNG